MAKVRVLTSLRVEIDPPGNVGRWCRTMERQAQALEEWARDFEAFVRDHRSQDPVQLSVIREHEDQCSHCGYAWEVDAEGPLCCEKAQEEWNAEKVAETVE